MTNTNLSSAEVSAVKLAYRTLGYVSYSGEQPEDMMDCDLEMWHLAHDVLKASNQTIPEAQRTSKAWHKAIAKAQSASTASAA